MTGKFDGKVIVMGDVHSSFTYQGLVCETIQNEARNIPNPSIGIFLELESSEHTRKLLNKLNAASIEVLGNTVVSPSFAKQTKLLLSKLAEVKKGYKIELIPIDQNDHDNSPAKNYVTICQGLYDLFAKKAISSTDFADALTNQIKKWTMFKKFNDVREEGMLSATTSSLDGRFNLAFAVVGTMHVDPLVKHLNSKGYTAQGIKYTQIDIEVTYGPIIDPMNSSSRHTTINESKLWRIVNEHRRVNGISLEARKLLGVIPTTDKLEMDHITYQRVELELEKYQKGKQRIKRQIEIFASDPKSMVIRDMNEEDLLIIGRGLLLSNLDYGSIEKFKGYVYKKDLGGLADLWDKTYGRQQPNESLDIRSLSSLSILRTEKTASLNKNKIKT
jgi:hypothetical protein